MRLLWQSTRNTLGRQALRSIGKGTWLRVAQRNMHVNLLPTVKSANFIQGILQDEKLRQRVTTFSIQASIVEWRNDHEEKCPTWEVHSSEDLRWYAVGSEEREK